MIRDVLLAGGVAMAYASQLEIPGAPFGYSELFLALWVMLSFVRVIAGGRLEVTPALSILAAFWLTLTVALAIGLIVGLLTTVWYLAAPVHDMIAYLLLASVTCLLAADPHADRHLRRTCWWIIAIADLCFAAQLALGFGLIHQSGVNPWFWDRFMGWSDNPNQLALYCAMFAPIALYLATTSSNRLAQLFAVASLALIVYVGRLTKSDTHLLTTVLTGVVFLGLRIRAWITTSERATVGRQAAIWLLVGLVPLSLSLSPYVLAETASVENFAKSLTKGEGGEATAETAALRISLWTNALGKGLESGSMGLGPGPHVDRSIVYKEFSDLPFEAHSTPLDLYTQGGLLAVLALFWIVGISAVYAWRSKIDAMVAMLVSIGIFGFPHLIVRHPIVWFSLTLCLVAGTPRPIAATAQAVDR
ncbi:polymerase [Mesorhizobium sp. VK25A]|uniref:Polymerase n=1 Tax=Mesorhizobium vachelliae TaxID=3072309 RepID=A0ABU5A8T6_9HYPH|nr:MULTISPECIES: polymerase [unclassified Mesorhizobium]MDX8534095.1 polymerase [Mesorhizobium sp. VK25D]MDX8548394.1 polymerase [Mesorhizobium sp. VK25A]